MARPLYSKRLSKELRDLAANPPEGVSVQDANDFKRWKLRICGAPGRRIRSGVSIYTRVSTGVTRSAFCPAPCTDSSTPKRTFYHHCTMLEPFYHVEEHIYSNGHICLNILYKDWSPVQTVAQVCLSIQSMLSSCTKKERPPDNDLYVKSAHASPKKTAWAFHDESV
ncbi:hypothetical protein LRAMOSA01710 [Lichtheimia ramosa]|uniref:UBC core domain-containing protein n=1 Tax=Lichtheimia ramosa TaxID=688394 RepID=A0A077WIY6_9FUNG|nr:hypothetical protein LRAMOSA01710 [Lichtheimia ramosa]